MIKEDIIRLIDKYYEGNSSLEEENMLFEYFKKEVIPAELIKYQGHFKLIQYAKSRQLPQDFEENFEKKNLNGEYKGKTKGLYLKIAASLTFLIFISFVAVLIFSKIPVVDTGTEEISTNINQQKAFLLSDGTKVWLNSSSRLNYPRKFSGKNRDVTLEGEAFFEVVKDKFHPFLVKTDGAQTQVLGTSFNVKSYTEAIEVVVVTGKVAFSSIKKEHSGRVFLLPNNGAVLDKKRNTISKIDKANPNLIAWKTHKLIFEDISLAEVVKVLSKYFSTQIEIIDPKLSSLKFKGTFKDASLKEVFKVLNYSMNISARKKGNKYLLTREAVGS